ncbi:YgaP family membrane protein [Rhodospira trueperi]|uniref:Inner membrane protein YgaP-like transmembrane domain-containing protein n=1 Tax=Rhodospira trueperi TaxID=69960 RepID=A0A1G7EWK1_9PROT|nr:DUF2892 domain-containing protein [Rhodospira trueperi]SDE67991.1 Protein of unknown function [Rhodospira trueperi]
MSKNLSTLDRLLRFGVGMTLIFAAIWWEPLSLWGWIGVIPVVTALVGWCPFYLPWGFRTRKTEQASAPGAKRAPSPRQSPAG